MTPERLVSADLEAFTVFASHLNFTHAADELHVSQPALHVRIRKLERALGETLYVRRGRTLRLTPAGEALAAFANQVQTQAAAFLSALGGSPRPALVFAAGAGAYRYLLGEAVRQYLGLHPGGLRLVTADADETVRRVRDGSADVGVTALAVLPDDLRCDSLARFPQVLAVRAGHRLARRRSLQLSDLDGEALVVPPRARPHRQDLERRLLDAEVDWSVAVEAEGWDLLTHFVEMGVGVTVVNGSVKTPPGLVAVPVKDLPVIRYYVVTRADPADDRVDSLRTLLARYVA
jgi:DNA-binding transcriptional LysR family regulator